MRDLKYTAPRIETVFLYFTFFMKNELILLQNKINEVFLWMSNDIQLCENNFPREVLILDECLYLILSCNLWIWNTILSNTQGDFLIIYIKRTVNFVHINNIINNKNCSKYYNILVSRINIRNYQH